MARTNNLSNFLTDVADAIRTKTGSQAAIQASSFDTEIESIPSGHDWSAIGFEQEPIGSQAAYQRAVTLKNNWDPETTEMPEGKFQQSDLVYMPDIDMRGITTPNAFESCFKCTLSKQVRVGPQTGTVVYPAGCLEAVAKIKAKPYGSALNMFYYCHRLVQLDLSGIDTSEITNMSSMFRECNSISSIDLSGFNTSNVSSMSAMFQQCNSLTSINLSSFNTSNVTDMSQMFRGCSSLTTLDLSSFDTSSATATNAMFYDCKSLTHLDIRNFTLSNVTTTTNTFGPSDLYGPPDNCEIIVKDDTQKTWINTNFSRLTNVKTVAEYEAEQNA